MDAQTLERRAPQDIPPYTLEPNAYYWVKSIRGNPANNGWMIAKRVTAKWLAFGTDRAINSANIVEVGAKVECPYKD